MYWMSDWRRLSVRTVVSQRRMKRRRSSYEMCFSVPPSRIERFCAAFWSSTRSSFAFGFFVPPLSPPAKSNVTSLERRLEAFQHA
jgi:hypothetical protein